MNRKAAAVIPLLALMAGVLACQTSEKVPLPDGKAMTSSTAAVATPTPTARPPATATPQTPTPVSSTGLHPLTTRTGVAVVDSVIEAVANREGVARASLTRLTALRCGVDPYTDPRCPSGVAAGSNVPVFLQRPGIPGDFIYDQATAGHFVVTALTREQLYVYAASRVTRATTFEQAYDVWFATHAAATGYWVVSVDAQGAIVRCMGVGNTALPGADRLPGDSILAPP